MSNMDASSLPNELWIYIASMLDGRSLGRLGCVSVRFATYDVPDPDHRGRLRPAEHWRLVDEGARRAFFARPAFVQEWFAGKNARSRPRMWLEAWSHADAISAPLAFDLTQCHEGITLSQAGASATLDTSHWIDGKLAHGYGAALCRTVMSAGRHYAEFKVTEDSSISMVGVISNAEFLHPHKREQQPVCALTQGVSTIRPTTAAVVRDARAQQAERLRALAGVYEGVHQTEFGWMICCGGLQRFFLWNDGTHTDYPGMPDFEHYSDQFLDLGPSGDAHEKGFIEGGGLIGLLLDVDKGSLAVYSNGKRCGLAVPHGLVPPLQWAVDLFEGETVTIDGPKPPPFVSAEMMRDEDQTWRRVEWRAVLEQRCAMSDAWEALH